MSGEKGKTHAKQIDAVASDRKHCHCISCENRSRSWSLGMVYAIFTSLDGEPFSSASHATVRSQILDPTQLHSSSVKYCWAQWGTAPALIFWVQLKMPASCWAVSFSPSRRCSHNNDAAWQRKGFFSFPGVLRWVLTEAAAVGICHWGPSPHGGAMWVSSD